MAIKIITDSTSYLDHNTIKELDIQIISLGITMHGETYKETEMDYNEFYDSLKSDKSFFPKSSQPNLEEFTTLMTTLVEEGHEIIGLFLSSKMSGTYQTACMIKQQILDEHPDAKIHLIDSLTNCMQLGFAARQGALLAKEGMDADSIVASCEDLLSKSQFIFMPDTFEYLKRGGRIGTAKALLGSLLKITPLLTVKEGVTTIFIKIRTKKKAILFLKDYLEEQITDYGLGDIIVHHIQNEEEGRMLADKLTQLTKRPVELRSIGPVIGTHVGPGAIGVAYYTKERRVDG